MLANCHSYIYHNELLKKQKSCENFLPQISILIYFALFVLVRMLYSMTQYSSSIFFLYLNIN